MPRYRLPPGHTLTLPGCTVADDTITLPFPLSLEEAHRLVVLATIEHARTAQDAAPLLGRSLTWVCQFWRGQRLPRTARPAPPLGPDRPTVRAEHEQTPLVDRARASSCPLCHQLAEWLAGRLCLPIPIGFDEARCRLLVAALDWADNDRSHAARLLGITRCTVYQWCRRYRIPHRRAQRGADEPRPKPAPLSRRGFGSRTPEERRAVARLGGQRLQALGLAHRYTSDEARIAGRQGGLAVSGDREHMADLGRKGAASRQAHRSPPSAQSPRLPAEKPHPWPPASKR